jgi:hypothetical protein
MARASAEHAKLRRLVPKWREMYKFESMEARLEYESSHPSRERAELQLTDAVEQRLIEREAAMDPQKSGALHFKRRAESLKKLHEAQVEDFIGRPGNGLARVAPLGPSYLYAGPTPSLPLARSQSNSAKEVPQAIPLSAAQSSLVGLKMPAKDLLMSFHDRSENNFLSPRRFGYIRDRKHVSGFDEHAFSNTPHLSDGTKRTRYSEATEQWAIGRLEWVSLLKHDKPTVYVSENLPRMNELNEGETRPLKGFESAALEQLIDGEDVIAQATTNRIYLVGSLRAINECTECHDARRGELLGAFTYELFRDPPIERRDMKAEKGPSLQ